MNIKVEINKMKNNKITVWMKPTVASLKKKFNEIDIPLTRLIQEKRRYKWPLQEWNRSITRHYKL